MAGETEENDYYLDEMSAEEVAETPGDVNAFLQQALENYRQSDLFYQHNVEEAVRDYRMLDNEDQWDEDIRQQREEKDRPCLSFPMLNKYVDQVMGDWRRNRPQVKIRDGAGIDPNAKMELVGGKKFKYSEVMGGLIRGIEYASQARIAYDYAIEGAVSGGFGHLRVNSDYTDDESFDQDILIERIHDHNSVKWDPSAIKYSREDGNYCFVDGEIPESEFKARYPAAITSSESIGADLTQGWVKEGIVRVSEYFLKKPKMRTIVELSDGRITDKEKIEPVLDELAAAGITIKREREVKSYVICWYLITAMDVLEGPVEMDDRYIPIVSFWGKEMYREGKWKFRSLIRNSHDSQRSLNYHRTAEIEQIALAPKAPFIMEERQMEGHEKEWSEANTENRAALTYKHVDGAAPPQRAVPPQPSAGLQQQSMQANEDIKSTIGMFDASIGNRSRETSGKAILARDEQSDAMAYPFVDNGARSMEYLGRILVDLIPKKYDTKRVMRIRHEDDTEDTVILNQTIVDQQTMQPVLVNDLSKAKFEVSVDIGPSYLTRKLESSDAMMQFATAVPKVAEIAGDLIARAQEWPGSQEIADRIRKTIPQDLLETEGEDEDKPKPPDPNLVIQDQMAEREGKLQEMEYAVRTKEAEASMMNAEVKKLEAQAAISGNQKVVEQMVSTVVMQVLAQNGLIQPQR